MRRVRSFAIIAAAFAVALGCGQGPAVLSSPPRSAVASAASSASPSAIACAPTEATGQPWWSDRVFYEVFVRSFQDSDGDGIGDLRGLTDRLDDLNDGDPATDADLGVTGLWLMPVTEAASYHGYDVTDYEAIERDYGSIDDFRRLVAAAHDRGIAVIVDLVINHTSRDHPWFRDAQTPGSAHDDWYVWADERPGFARSDGTRVWHASGDRFYYAYFWEGMPDLNLANPQVTAAVDEVGQFWLEEMGADGFRLDAARHLIEDGRMLENTPATFEWLSAFRKRLEGVDREALLLGEVWDATSMSSRYVRDGSLDMAFDFGLASATITSLRSGDAGTLRAAQREVAESYPPGGVATFLTNHDQDRIVDQLGRDPAAARLAATLLLTGGGVPFIYYGEEIGMTGRKPDERIRTPMRWDSTGPGAGFTDGTPWEPLGDDPPGTDVATERADPGSLLSHYRDLIALRSAHPALSRGTWLPARAQPAAINAFLRHAGDETVLVVVNVSEEAVERPAITLQEGPLCGPIDPRMLLGEGEVAAPAIGPKGGFEDYVPVDRLRPREAIVVSLQAP
jgi:glycosidase